MFSNQRDDEMFRLILGVAIGILVGVLLIAPDPTWSARVQAWWGDLREAVAGAATIAEDAGERAGAAVEGAPEATGDGLDGGTDGR